MRWLAFLILPVALVAAAVLCLLRERRLIGLPRAAMDRWRQTPLLGKILVCVLFAQFSYDAVTKPLRNPPQQTPASAVTVVQPDAGDLDAGFEATNLCFTAIERGTNSTALLFAWSPDTRPPLDRVGLFLTLELPGPWTHLFDVDISSCVSNALVEVMDSEIATNSPPTAFFRLGDPAPPDADGDGLSDAEETGEIMVRNEFEWHDTTGFDTVYEPPPPSGLESFMPASLVATLPGNPVIQEIPLTGVVAFGNGYVSLTAPGDFYGWIYPSVPRPLCYRWYNSGSILVAPYWGYGNLQYGNTNSYMRVGTLLDGTAVVEFHGVSRNGGSSDLVTYQVIVPGGTGNVVRVSYLSSDVWLDGTDVVAGVQNARRTLPGGMVYSLEWDFAERGPILPGTTVEYRFGTGTDPDSDDSDNDGVNDWTELYEAGTDPWDPDTDGDDLSDGDEIAWGTDPHATDTDGDGLPDAWEVANGLDPTLGVGDDGASGDPDGDGLTNAQERQLGTNPQDPDTDNDGLDDYVEIEMETDPLNEDSDGDGLVDGAEIVYETNPLYKDTDGDCLWDGWEVSSGMDPTVDNATDENSQNDLAADPDGDGLNNWQEFVHGSLPYNAHTFNTTVSDQVYVQNGMSMTSPTNGIVLRISVGDSSQSTSERWGIILTDAERNERYYTVACDAYGQVTSQDLILERGRHYQGVLIHYGSRLSEPDYDWTAQIDTLPATNVLSAGRSHSEGDRWIAIRDKGVLIDNADGLLGLSNDSFDSTDNSVGKVFELYVLSRPSITGPRTIGVNGDDDDGNGVADWEDSTSGMDEDDLAEVVVSAPSPRGIGGTITVTPYISCTAGQMWKDKNKSEDIVSDSFATSDDGETSHTYYLEGSNYSSYHLAERIRVVFDVHGVSLTNEHRFTFIQRVAEPITVLRCGGAIVNPCCAIIGEAVPMKVSVLPADFPDGAIKWRVVSGSGTFADGDTGRNVSFTATGSENSEAKLQIDVGDCPGRAPQFTLREMAMHEVRIYPCVISRRDHPSSVNVAKISAVLDEVNVIFRQVGMHFSLGSPPIIIENDQFARWGLASRNIGKQIRNIMSGTDGIEVYFVPGLEEDEAKEHFQPLGTCSPYGIIVSYLVHPSTLAHEIGHACGLCDIYFRRDNMTPPSLLQGVRESWLPGDWNNGTGCRFYSPILTQQDLIQRLLMFGEGDGTKADIPYGMVFGLSARDGLQDINVGRGVFMSLSPRSL